MSLGQRFESARRLFEISLDKLISRNVEAVSLSPGALDITELLAEGLSISSALFLPI
jgi:hypothetical protein